MALTNTINNLIDNLTSKYEKSGQDLAKQLLSAKDEALDNLKNLGLPDHKSEEYKYFNVQRKINRDYSFQLLEELPLVHAWVKSNMIDDVEGIHIVYINGLLSGQLSTVDQNIEGFDFFEFNGNSKQKDEIIKFYLQQRQNINSDRYIDLNNAFLNAGFILNLDKKFIARPIYIYHFVTDHLQETIINKKGIVVLEKDSQANIVEIFYSKNKNHYFRNQNTEVFVKEGSLLNYFLIQETGSEAVSVNNTNIYQSENSRVNTYSFSLRGKHLRNNLNMLLNHENCESHLYGLYFVSDEDHIDNHTTVDHKKPHCYSNEYYKGIIDDNGAGTFNGKIYVRPNAQKTNAFQSNKNLVLTDSATINTKPQLEIWADDVKCSHGATTGQLDEEQLFYLRSRGLTKDSATALLLHAFAFEIVDKVELKFLRKYIADKINQRLGYQFSN